MKNSERIAELDAEVQALRAEVAQLRAAQLSHYCHIPQPVVTWPQPDPWQQWQTTCAAPMAGVYTVNGSAQTFANTGCATPSATLVLNGAN